MLATYIELRRDELLGQVIAFLELSYESTVAPAKVGGAGSRMGPIPAALRNTAEAAGHESIFLSSEESAAYADLLQHLGVLRETEWLDTDQLQAKLWDLACEIAIRPQLFADYATRRIRAEQFLEGVLHPLREFEVIFTVRHITPPVDPVELWDARLVSATAALLRPFLDPRVEEDRQAHLMAPFVGGTALMLREHGASCGPVIERSRQRAAHRLHVLRSTLADHWQVHPAQLLFALGDDAWARTSTAPFDGLPVATRPPTAPIDLGIHSGLQDSLDSMRTTFKGFATCHPTVRSAVERAAEWVGRGLCRHWPGDAIRDYTTASEVLLIIPGERQKSVLVPYRMVTLADLHSATMPHPAAVRHAYDRRSIVVHEGLGEAGDEQATRRMLAVASDCARWLMAFATAMPGEDHATLVRSLDTPNAREKAIVWLRQFSDPWSQALVKRIGELPRR